jgi:GNAT superfamily N-acetyltransferase
MDGVCFPDDRRIKPTAKEGTRWWLVTADKHHDAGYAAMTPSVQWSDAVYLSRAGVMPAYRGHGLQRKLIRVRIAAARRAGFQWAITDTSYDNNSSSNNLIREGFRLFAPSAPWGLFRGLYWMKEL